MNTRLTSTANTAPGGSPERLMRGGIALLGRLPDWPLALLGRFAIAGIF